jgi:tripartite-type tricarboxylate transporter receptor subunit TctC
VPYKGAPQGVLAVMSGEVTMGFFNTPTVIGQIKEGKVKALGVTSLTRSPLLPNVPTLAEAGVKVVDVYSWQAVVAPKGLPADVRNHLHAAIVAALNDAQVRQRFTSVGFEIVGNTPEQFAAFQQSEFARWKKVIETGKITAD